MPRKMKPYRPHRSKKSKKRSREKARKMSKRCNTAGWKKEKAEHPWATDKQAKQIACDHHRK